MLCRRGGGELVIGSRGELPTARVIRALAKASEVENGPLEFKTLWHEDPDQGRSLRYVVEMRTDWKLFRKQWAQLATAGIGERNKMVPVTPLKTVKALAAAITAEQQNHGFAVMALNSSNTAVLNIAAKAL